MTSAGMNKCIKIMASLKENGKKVGDKLTHCAIDQYIGTVAGLDARTIVRYKQSLTQFGYITATETGFQIKRFEANKG